MISREVFEVAEDSSEKLKLIDAIQRLGLSYQFERKMDETLQHMNDTYKDHVHDGDLYNVALRFRLLRQHGYNVSSGKPQLTWLFGTYVPWTSYD